MIHSAKPRHKLSQVGVTQWLSDCLRTQGYCVLFLILGGKQFLEYDVNYTFFIAVAALYQVKFLYILSLLMVFSRNRQ